MCKCTLLCKLTWCNMFPLRRKSALPKYEPPYLKRPMMQPGGGGGGKGYSHPNSPHPSQIPVGPPDHTLLGDGGGKGVITYTPTPAYRSVE